MEGCGAGGNSEYNKDGGFAVVSGLSKDIDDHTERQDERTKGIYAKCYHHCFWQIVEERRRCGC